MKGRWHSNLAQLLLACPRRTGDFIVLTVVLLSCSAQAAGQQIRRDEPAVAALEAMSTYLAGLDHFVITGTSLTDTRLDAGLIVASPAEIAITVDRPNSLYMKQFNGERTLNLYVHNAVLNLYDSAAAFYAGTEVPPGIEAGIEYALEELDIEMPLADLIHADVFTHLVGATDEVIYRRGRRRDYSFHRRGLIRRRTAPLVQSLVREMTRAFANANGNDGDEAGGAADPAAAAAGALAPLGLAGP